MDRGPKQVAIVGGGLAGLATAAYLGRAGHRVTLFERSATLGGRGTSSEKNGYIHNFGPHALYRGGPGEDVLRELGVEYSGNTPDLDGIAVRRGRAFTLPVGGRSMLTTRLFGVRARVEAGRQALALRKASPDESRTVSQWLADEFREPAAREYLQALIRLGTYANAPDETSLADAARQFSAAGGGVLYIDGGWRMLTDGLRAKSASQGIDIRAGVRVDAVERGPAGWTVRLDGGEAFECDAVVLAVAPDVAAGLRGENPGLARFAADAVPARAACLDIGLRRLPNPRRRFALGIDAPYYLSVHSLYANLAPEGRVMVSVAKYIPAGETHYAERARAELEGFLETVQPGWRDLEEHRQFLPNMVVTTAVPRADRGGIAGRPDAAAAGEDGLFLAGDWVGQGGWLADGTLGSAREAAAAASKWLAGLPETALAGAVG